MSLSLATAVDAPESGSSEASSDASATRPAAAARGGPGRDDAPSDGSAPSGVRLVRGRLRQRDQRRARRSRSGRRRPWRREPWRRSAVAAAAVAAAVAAVVADARPSGSVGDRPRHRTFRAGLGRARRHRAHARGPLGQRRHVVRGRLAATSRTSIAGASHFLEHLLFKGTEPSARPAPSPLAVDAVGGEMNAYTSREHTAYYLRLPVAELEPGLRLLADVVSEPAFRPHELDAEREVIVEEILMSEDTPDDLVLTALYESLFPDHPLGRETLGTRDSVEAMTRDDDRRLPPAVVPARQPGRGGGRRPRPRPRRWPRSTASSPVGERGDAPVAHRPAGRRSCRWWSSTARPSSPTWPSAGGVCPRATTTATPCGWPTTCSAAACRAGCSRRSARSAASPTRSSPRRRPTATSESLVIYSGTAPSRLGELLEVIDAVDRRPRRRRHHRRGAPRGPRLPRGLDAAGARGQRLAAWPASDRGSRPRRGRLGRRARGAASGPSPATTCPAVAAPGASTDRGPWPPSARSAAATSSRLDRRCARE